MDLMQQYKDLLAAKSTLESRLLVIAEAQFALDKEAYFETFPEEAAKGPHAVSRNFRHFAIMIDDFRINDEGKCEAWEYGRCGNPDEAIYEFEIDISLDKAAYKADRLKFYAAEKQKRADDAAAEIERKRQSLQRQLAELS